MQRYQILSVNYKTKCAVLWDKRRKQYGVIDVDRDCFRIPEAKYFNPVSREEFPAFMQREEHNCHTPKITGADSIVEIFNHINRVHRNEDESALTLSPVGQAQQRIRNLQLELGEKTAQLMRMQWAQKQRAA